MKTKNLLKILTGLFVVFGFAVVINAETRGVSDTEILIGTHTALSGPVAGWGIPTTKGIRLRFDEANAKGGIHGRIIRLLAEDSQYRVPIAVQKANKLIYRDNVFAMLASIGTPMNNAVFKFQFKENVPSLFPMSNSPSMIEPLNKLKFTAIPTDYDAMRAGVKYYVEKKGKKRVCLMAIDTDYGEVTTNGVVDQLKAMNMKLTAKTVHKASETNFTAPIMKLRKANCDVVMLGTIIRDTIIAVSTARKLGWNVDFVGNVSVCNSIVANKGGPLLDGLVGVNIVDVLPKTPVTERGRAFVKNYKKKYGVMPNESSVIGYIYADLTVLGLENAGRNLTVDSLIRGIESIKSYKSPFLGPDRSFGPKKHKGHSKSWLLVLKNKKWVLPTGKIEYLTY